MGNICGSDSNKEDGPNFPQLPSTNIFDEHSLKFPCYKNASMSHCLAAQRISKILINFDKFKNNPNSCNIQSMHEYIQELGTSYNNRQLLNDYIHLINNHHTNEDFEAVYNYFVSEMQNPCNVITCNNIERNNRDRSNDHDVNIRMELYASEDSKEVNTQQILDKVHCFWLHTFDLGYRLTLKERDTVQRSNKNDIASNDIDTDTKTNDNTPASMDEEEAVDDEVLLRDCVDNELLQRQQIIISKRKRLMGIDNNNINVPSSADDNVQQRMLRRNKSIQLMLNDRNNKFILNGQGHKAINKDEEVIYSFGFPFKYGQFNKNREWYIRYKYDSMKEELINNAIDKLSKQQYDDWYEKALDHHASDYCQQEILLYLGVNITVEHVLSIMIYCGIDWLQRSFTETYRKLTANESDDELKKRHSEYANWGKILDEAVNHFGTDVEKGNYKKFYHGIDKQMTFESTIAYFCGPLSTSSEYEVSLVFANQKGDGLIIELQNLDKGRAKYFDCAWLSEYAYESEKLFIGGTDGVIIKNIIAPQIGQNYEIYVEGLNIIQQMMRGHMYRNSNPPKKKQQRRKEKQKRQIKTPPIQKHIKKCVVKLLNHELHRYLPDDYEQYKDLPKYISDSLNYYCLNQEEISIDWRSLHEQNETRPEKGYLFASQLFILNNFNKSWLDLDLLCILFPNLSKITVSDLNLCRDTLDAISSHCQQAQLNQDDIKSEPEDDDNENDEKRKETKEEKTKLKEIIIYRPTKDTTFEYQSSMVAADDDDDEKNVKHTGSIDMATKEYQEELAKYGWKMKKKARFELAITKHTIISNNTQ